jgi:hypothetical protein
MTDQNKPKRDFDEFDKLKPNEKKALLDKDLTEKSDGPERTRRIEDAAKEAPDGLQGDKD